MKMGTFQHRPHRLLLGTQSSAPPTAAATATTENGNRTRSAAFTNEANFDKNMVIILAALLCALICALGLNSIVRCALRCSRRFSFETTADENAAQRLGGASSTTTTTGMKKSALRRIPVAVYSSGTNIKATDCPICLGEFVDGEKVRVLPICNHSFHVRCVDTWLLSHSSCPTCRQSLTDQTANNSHAAASPEIEGGIFQQHGNSSGADVPDEAG